jgi:peptidoglycan/xylan/chitin deacetylase (PgdA/CDA1 family)
MQALPTRAMGDHTRLSLLTLAHALGGARLYRRFANRRHGHPVRILSGHRVINEAGPLSDRDRADLARGCLMLSDFIERVLHLRDRYAVLSLDECVADLLRGIEPPESTVILTFDDGCRDVYANAWPVLLRYELPFAIFLTTTLVGSGPLWMEEAEIREMAEKGRGLITWGAHGVTHTPLTELPLEAAEREIAESRTAVERLVGAPVRFFSYPDGKHDDRLRALLMKHGFEGACVTGRAMNFGQVDPFALKRIPFESEPFARFAFRVAGRV